MKKRLIATRTDNNLKQINDLTLPFIKEYASKCNAEFLLLNQKPPIMTDDGHPHFRIMTLHNLLNIYDRICLIDVDTLVMPECPDLFKLVPKNKIGTVLEDKGSRQKHRRECIQKIQSLFGNIGWISGYINTGVFVISKIHQPIFQPINGKYYTAWGSDDLHLGWQIHKYGFQIYELPYQFNSMRCFWESWNGSPNRLNSYIIHYAGFPLKKRLEMIRQDLSIIKDSQLEGTNA